MAEVSSEEGLQKKEENLFIEDPENPISVLLLATKWQFDTYGLSTVNKSLVDNLRKVDPHGQKIKITCAVVEDDKYIKDDEKRDAEKYKVKLKGAKQPRGPKKKPNREWLDQSTGAYYLDLFMEDTFDFIIGHVPYLANGSFNFKDMYLHRDKKPKIVLLVHGLPKTTSGDVDDDSLLEWLSDSDFIFSVGKEVESEIWSSIASLPPEEQPIHKLYIPAFPVELFNVGRGKVHGNKVRGTQIVNLMTGDRKDLEINGLDFPLAVASLSNASKHILDFDGVKTNFTLLSDNKEDKDEWKREFSELLQKEGSKGRSLNFQPDTPETLGKLKAHMRKSNLFILPLKPNSPLFGTEDLSAVAAGVPVLVSSYSGMASVLEEIAQNESIVRESSLESDEETWKDKVIRKLVKPEDSQQTANVLREQLLLDTKITQTHLDFTRIICDTSCVQLKVELNSRSVVAQEQIDTAVKFGIDFGDLTAPVETQKYVLGFIQKLLLHRDKLGLGLLGEYCRPDVVTAWQEVLSSLENSHRKVVAVESGSLVFTLLCLTSNSAQQLTYKSWNKFVMSKMENLLLKLGVEPQLRIYPSEGVASLPETGLLPGLREMKRETTPSDVVTKHSSEIMSEVVYERSKVMEWPEHHTESTGQPEAEDTPAISLHETMKIDWPDSMEAVLYKTFSVSESGSIAVSSTQGNPSLYITYPGINKPSLFLPTDYNSLSILFVAISDQQYFASTFNCQIILSNLAKKSLSVVYEFKEGKELHLCAIDERSVACVAEQPSVDGFKNVHILNTDSEKWRLRSTHSMRMGRSSTGDICYVKTGDGTPCLILNCLSDRCVQATEMIGGKLRWLLDEQQMGQSFRLWSICTDGSTIFIADLFLDGLHLASVDEGSVLKSIWLRPFNIFLPSCVRLQGEHLHVGHVDEKRENYCISKFTMPSTN